MDGPIRDMGPAWGPSLLVGLHDTSPKLELAAPLRGAPPLLPSPSFLSFLSGLALRPPITSPKQLGLVSAPHSLSLPYQLDFFSYSILLENIGSGVPPPTCQSPGAGGRLLGGDPSVPVVQALSCRLRTKHAGASPARARALSAVAGRRFAEKVFFAFKWSAFGIRHTHI